MQAEPEHAPMNTTTINPSWTPKPEAVAQDNDYVLLLLQVPRTNEKKELAAEQMFASLHGLLMVPSHKRFQAPQRVAVSFEIAVLKKRIGFYVCVPRYLVDFVEEQIYAQYPTVQISVVEDYAGEAETVRQTTVATEMKLASHDALPIKTFQSFEVDPLAAITATLAKFDETEEAWIQLLVRPAAHNWHKRSERYIDGVRGTQPSLSPGAIASMLWGGSDGKSASPAKLAEYQQARASGAEDKSHKLGFESTLRIVYRGDVGMSQASLRLQSIVASYKQFNTTYLNGFEQGKPSTDPAIILKYHERKLTSKPFLLNIEEVATLYHLPHTNVETPFILWALSQTAEPPANLPVIGETTRQDISPIATANFRGHNMAFGIPRPDRGRHLYILGQTGVGKSGLLELLTLSDIDSPYGFAIIDPHGDYAMNILRRIPESRAKDVIYFNPADTEFPIAFNPMEVTDPKLRTHTASELIGVLKRMFESWGPRLEYILRYSLLALLEYPDATMLDITRILTDKKFRAEVLTHVTDPVVRNFWLVEFASWNDKFAAEAVAPVLNKVGAFTANPIVRNIIGQPKSSFNIRQIMDERKILIVNLTRGLVGEDNAALLGALMVTKIQLASMSRADIPIEERAPFYLYVDEFQHFATDSFATILSEARKYGLNLTVANQYIAQMSQEVKDAVFGNVGSIVAFRMGADDARSMQRYFEPKFTEYDLVHMHNRHFVVSMTIDGEKSQAFSAVSLDLPGRDEDQSPVIIENSRQLYALQRSAVDAYINTRYNLSKQKIEAPHSSKQPALPPKTSETQKPKSVPAEVQSATVHRPESGGKTDPTSAEKPLHRVTGMGRAAMVASAVELVKAKRKRRRRSRAKKNTDTLASNTEFVIFSKNDN
jgi:hypothetical protein